MNEEPTQMTNRVGDAPRLGFLSVYLIAVLCLAGCNSASLRSLTVWKLAGDRVAAIEETISDSDYVPLEIWHESYATAQRIAAEHDEAVLVVFTGSDFCKPCKDLKRKVLDSDEFMAWTEGKVVLLELDYPRETKQSAAIKEQNEALKQRYQITRYPTILLLDHNGDVLGQIAAEKDQTPVSFMEKAEAILGI